MPARLLSCLFRWSRRPGNGEAHATGRARSGWPPRCQTCARGWRESCGTRDADHPSEDALVSDGFHNAGYGPSGSSSLDPCDHKQDLLTIILTTCYCVRCNTYFAIRNLVKAFARRFACRYIQINSSWRVQNRCGLRAGFKYFTRSPIEVVVQPTPSLTAGACMVSRASRKASPWACLSRLTRVRFTRLKEAGLKRSHCRTVARPWQARLLRFFEHVTPGLAGYACKGCGPKQERAATRIEGQCPHSPDCFSSFINSCDEIGL